MQQNGGTTNPLDSWNLHKEKSYSAMDLPHVFVTSAGYELPFGKGKPWASQNPSGARAVGGWQLNGILTTSERIPDGHPQRPGCGDQPVVCNVQCA